MVEIDRELTDRLGKMETVRDFFLGGGEGTKSLQMVTAARKLKDVCSLEENL